MDFIEKIMSIHGEGYNCAQTVFLIFAEEYGLSRDMALKLAAGFGGGMGRKGEVCGAASAGVMLLGLAKCSSVAGQESKENNYHIVQAYLNEFAKRNGSILCHEMINCRLEDPVSLQKAKDSGILQAVCPKAMAESCNILEEMLKKE